MYTKIVYLDDEIVYAAEKYFGEDFCNHLKDKENYRGSLVGRYFIDQYIVKQNGKCTHMFADDFTVDGYFFSISHTKNYVAIIVSSQKCAIDIAEYEQRSGELLRKYAGEIGLFESEKQSEDKREAFYKMRVTKETLVKYKNLSFGEIENMRVVATKDKQVMVEYMGEIYGVDVERGESDVIVGRMW